MKADYYVYWWGRNKRNFNAQFYFPLPASAPLIGAWVICRQNEGRCSNLITQDHKWVHRWRFHTKLWLCTVTRTTSSHWIGQATLLISAFDLLLLRFNPGTWQTQQSSLCRTRCVFLSACVLAQTQRAKCVTKDKRQTKKSVRMISHSVWRHRRQEHRSSAIHTDGEVTGTWLVIYWRVSKHRKERIKNQTEKKNAPNIQLEKVFLRWADGLEQKNTFSKWIKTACICIFLKLLKWKFDNIVDEAV